MKPGDEAGALREEEETHVDSAADAHDDPAPAEPDPGATTDDASENAGEASADASAEEVEEAPVAKTRAEKKAEKAAAKAEKARQKAERASAAAKASAVAAEETPAGDAPAAEENAAVSEDEAAAEAGSETVVSETAGSEAVAGDEGEGPDDEAPEPGASSEDPGEDVDDEAEAPRPAGLWAASVAVLVVLLIAGAVTAGLYWNKAGNASADTSGRQAAISTAKTAVSDLFTIDYKNPNAFAARLKPIAAGKFLGVINNSAGGVSKLLQQGKVQTTGKAQLAGVESFKGDTAQVAVLGQEIIKNSQNPQGGERSYRMVLSMVKSGSKWVVSNLEFVQ